MYTKVQFYFLGLHSSWVEDGCHHNQWQSPYVHNEGTGNHSRYKEGCDACIPKSNTVSEKIAIFPYYLDHQDIVQRASATRCISPSILLWYPASSSL